MGENYNDELLKAVLTVVQDGICFLSPELDVLYSNPALSDWYKQASGSVGKKCYKVFHGRRCPCENCPARKCMESRKCESIDQIYEISEKKKGCQKVYCTPVYDEEDTPVMLVEYIRDVTDDVRHETQIELLDHKIQVLLDQIAKGKEAAAVSERTRVERTGKTVNSVLRFLRKLLDDDSYLFVERQLNEIGEKSSVGVDYLFTSHERLVISYIKEGLISKEIAEKMHISKKTVDFHRRNIRRKLNLSQTDDLRIKLMEILV